jgi:hypothetical protein
MGTMKRSLLRAGLAASLGLVLAAALPQAAQAQVVASDAPAAILVYPKVIVDTSGLLGGLVSYDTILELSNTHELDLVSVHCFYVNALGTCSQSEAPCLVNFDCSGVFSGETCQENWAVTDFRFTMTREQPIGWLAGSGLQFLPCDAAQNQFCNGGQQNANLQGPGSAIPPTDDPFLGELKCVETDEDGEPVAANDLIGRATVHASPVNGPVVNPIDVATYNAIGIQAGTSNDSDETLCLGANTTGDCTTAEYASCPTTLILNHFFEGVVDADGSEVRTSLTLVPCSQFQGTLETFPTTAQFLIFNEFEQRFSASTGVECYSDLLLADVDTRASFTLDDASSIFWVGTQGTFTGQTRIRGVPTSETDLGHGLLGLATESRIPQVGAPQTASADLQFVGVRSQADIIEIDSIP